MGRQSFLKPEKWLGRHERKSLLTKEKEVFLRRTLSPGSQNGIGVFSDRGRRTTNWLGPWKVPSNYGCCWKGIPFAKLPCQNQQYNYQIYWTQFYQGNNFYNNYNKKIIIKIVTSAKLFAKASWCRRCQHRAHHNRTPPC